MWYNISYKLQKMIRKTKLEINKDEDTDKALDNWKKLPADKEYLKRRKKLECCKSKRQDNIRAKYGTSSCDSYSLKHRLGIIIGNNLFQYIADAKPRIERDDWEEIEKHAQSFQDYANADNWDLCDDDLTIRNEYMKKETKFREAIFWLQENLQSLWW
jgi:hypothetical protein